MGSPDFGVEPSALDPSGPIFPSHVLRPSPIAVAHVVTIILCHRGSSFEGDLHCLFTKRTDNSEYRRDGWSSGRGYVKGPVPGPSRHAISDAVPRRTMRRSEDRRAGIEWVSTCRSRWSSSP